MGSYGLQEENMCRVCCENGDELIDIFGEVANKAQLRDKLSFYLPLEVIPMLVT